MKPVTSSKERTAVSADEDWCERASASAHQRILGGHGIQLTLNPEAI
jgi:hypothetical protein